MKPDFMVRKEEISCLQDAFKSEVHAIPKGELSTMTAC